MTPRMSKDNEQAARQHRTEDKMVRRRSWALTVFVLLAGLLGMHGLSNHDGMTGMSAAPAMVRSTSAIAMDHSSVEHQSAVSAESSRASVGRDSPTASRAAMPAAAGQVVAVLAESGAGGAMTHPLCVAILSATALLLLLALRRTRHRRQSAPRPARAPAVLSLLLRPPSRPDLVAGLCVSRT